MSTVDEVVATSDPTNIVELVKHTSSLNQRDEKDTDIFDLLYPNTSNEERAKKSHSEIAEARDDFLEAKQNYLDTHTSEQQIDSFATVHGDEALAGHLDGFRGVNYVPQAALNYTLPWRKQTEPRNPHVENFMQPSNPDLYRFDKQVLIFNILFK